MPVVLLSNARTWQRVFCAAGDFAAINEAEKFLLARGYSIGPMAGGMPMGVKLGKYQIAKYYGLSRSDRAQLDGEIESDDFRAGPVTVTLRLQPPEAGRE